MKRDLAACVLMCGLLAAVCGSAYSIASGKTIRLPAVENGIGDLYAEYLRVDTDRARVAFDQHIRNGIK